jgi:hypothetical protein
MEDLHYPNLATCRVRLTSSAASSRPPVVLPREVREASKMVINEEPFDFTLGSFFYVESFGQQIARIVCCSW